MRQIYKRLYNLWGNPTAHKSASDDSFFSDREEAERHCVHPRAHPTTLQPLPEPTGIFTSRPDRKRTENLKTTESWAFNPRASQKFINR